MCKESEQDFSNDGLVTSKLKMYISYNSYLRLFIIFIITIIIIISIIIIIIIIIIIDHEIAGSIPGTSKILNVD